MKTTTTNKAMEAAERLTHVYGEIAGLKLDADAGFLEQLGKRDARLYEALGEAVLAFVSRAVKSSLHQRAVRLCAESHLDMDDIVQDLTLELLGKTAQNAVLPGEEQIRHAYRLLNSRLTDSWRKQTAHWTKGIFLSSLEEMLENAYEPVLDRASSAPTPEQEVLLADKGSYDEVFELLQSTLNPRQLAAVIHTATRRYGLDQDVADHWLRTHAELSRQSFRPGTQDLTSAACSGRRRLKMKQPELKARIHDILS